MKKLISIGVIVAILATILVTALASGMPIDPLPPPTPVRLQYFSIDWSGISIDGRIRAIEGDDRKLELRITAECTDESYFLDELWLVVALWSEDNPALYRTYHHHEDIDMDVGEWTFTLSVKEDGIIDSPKYGLVYVWANPGWGYGKFKTYAIKFISYTWPVIYAYPYNIIGLWNMYQHLETFPACYP